MNDAALSRMPCLHHAEILPRITIRLGLATPSLASSTSVSWPEKPAAIAATADTAGVVGATVVVAEVLAEFAVKGEGESSGIGLPHGGT